MIKYIPTENICKIRNFEIKKRQTFLTTIDININRLNHLLKLYRLSKGELLAYLNEGRKTSLSESDVFGKQIKISLLKKIDGLFKKGLEFYIDPKDLSELKEESIFFRKKKFNAKLSLGAKQIVTYFEEEKVAFSALSKLADLTSERTLPFFTAKNNPQKVAAELRTRLYPAFNTDGKKFLAALISKLAENKVLVFEFIEAWNKKEKANIDGFYLSPNVIVLKRQKSYRREVFTLIHELGHYLLNLEEIDEGMGEDFSVYEHLTTIERWCNDFAYFFLAGEHQQSISNIENASSENDYHHELINEISKQTHLSEHALYTRLRLNGTMTTHDYDLIVTKFKNKYRENEEELKKAKEREKQEGRISHARAARPILSPLYVNIIQLAFIEGIIGEREFCKRLHVKPENIHKYLK